ncbi:hypothetical protein [Maritimibacter sp. HL-12]|jgi:hypothetical protein|uniref:hypothetical protein n=1 Tax=Maritimibacter sp. HL-12 TaxID=1162418 RepID=UPI000A0F0E39|nr:hypothetical protein [Maritimibacter sp. HL-12]SMH48073.1 hypothetical protein SAMN05661107_1946 [Maritimibacter sp. HL-12]
MHTNVIAFARARKTANRATATIQSVRDNVITMAEWKTRVRARRTASGVFFTTGVLVTCGNVA